MPTTHQNRARYWLSIRGLMRWRTPVLLLFGWLLLTALAAVLFAISQRYWLTPALTQSYHRQLDQLSSTLSRQLQTVPLSDRVTRASEFAAANHAQAQWTAMHRVVADGDALIHPARTFDLPVDAVASPWRQSSVQSPPGLALENQANQADSDMYFRLVRDSWPWYQRSDVLAFLLISCCFYAPALAWFYYRFVRSFLRMSNRILGELVPVPHQAHAESDVESDAVAPLALDLSALGQQLQQHVVRITQREQDASRNAQVSLRVAAHEIRRPLQRMAFAIQSLEEPLQQQAPKLHLIMHQALDEMAEIVEEALWYSRLSHRPVPLSPHHFAIESLVSHLVEPLRDIHPGYEFSIEPGAPTPDTFRADRKMLERAVANLLNNAVKYGAGKVLLSWQWSDDELLLTVHDNGPGVPAEQRKRLFEPFMARSADMEERPHGGLGLAIVKEVCVSHGGKARMTESPLGGAAVILCLPLNGQVIAPGTD